MQIKIFFFTIFFFFYTVLRVRFFLCFTPLYVWVLDFRLLFFYIVLGVMFFFYFLLKLFLCTSYGQYFDTKIAKAFAVVLVWSYEFLWKREVLKLQTVITFAYEFRIGRFFVISHKKKSRSTFASYAIDGFSDIQNGNVFCLFLIFTYRVFFFFLHRFTIGFSFFTPFCMKCFSFFTSICV